MKTNPALYARVGQTDAAFGGSEVVLTAGNTTGASRTGGKIIITAGAGTSASLGAGGDVEINGGLAAGSTGGAISLLAGRTLASTSGSISIRTPNAGRSGGDGTDVLLCGVLHKKGKRNDC